MKKLIKNYLVKKSRILPKNTKRDPLGLLNVFYKRKLQKIQGVPFDRIQKFSEKCLSAKKNAKGDPLVSSLLLEA